ncbi:MAG TPA: BON domain-containing protein [Pirellulales bacterium]|jgi:hypothetical protein|nr:BON domain-containing protein [Pirellulales bacterium]
MDKLHEIVPVASIAAPPRADAAAAALAGHSPPTSEPSSPASSMPSSQAPTGRRSASRVEKLAARIARVVERRTSGSIVGLTVEIRRDGVHLGGRCATFYSKQLAQQAAMGVAEDEPLTNEIEVG